MRLVHRIRGLAIAMVSASVVVAAAIAPVATVVSATIMSSPTPRWVRQLGLNTILSRSDIWDIATGIGIVVAIGAIPAARMLLRRFHRQHARRLFLLGEAVTARIGLGVREDSEEEAGR